MSYKFDIYYCDMICRDCNGHNFFRWGNIEYMQIQDTCRCEYDINNMDVIRVDDGCLVIWEEK